MIKIAHDHLRTLLRPSLACFRPSETHFPLHGGQTSWGALPYPKIRNVNRRRGLAEFLPVKPSVGKSEVGRALQSRQESDLDGLQCVVVRQFFTRGG